MAVNRRDARRLALQSMYAMECTGYTVGQTFLIMRGFDEEWNEPPDFTRQLCQSIENHRQEIEKNLEQVLEHWKLDRVGLVERALLKLACTEIDHFPDIPPRVTINEYLELAKLYSNENAPAFLNGVLDKLVHLRQKPDVHVEKLKRRASEG